MCRLGGLSGLVKVGAPSDIGVGGGISLVEYSLRSSVDDSAETSDGFLCKPAARDAFSSASDWLVPTLSYRPRAEPEDREDTTEWFLRIRGAGAGAGAGAEAGVGMDTGSNAGAGET